MRGRERTCQLSIERLLHMRQQIGRATARGRHKMRGRRREPLVLQRLRRRRPPLRVNRQTGPHKVARGVRDVRPILLRLEFVVARDDRLHLELGCVAIERRVPREKEVGDDTHRPDVDGLAVARCEEKHMLN